MTSRAKRDALVVAAIDCGTTYSGYAYSFRSDPRTVLANDWGESQHLLSGKTSTTILLNKAKQFVAFGQEAEETYTDAWDNDHQGQYVLFRRFKMHLHNIPTLNRETTIKDVSGLVEVPAIDIFTMAIRYMKNHLMRSLNRSKSTFSEDDVHFVITVPALWDDKAKLLMRESALEAGIKRESLTIALESEAASIWCQTIPLKSSGAVKLTDKGTQYMTVDIGGGTADVTTHESMGDGSLHSIHCPGGGDWGGTMVDDTFKHLLEAALGKHAMDKFLETKVGDMLELMREFETTKRTIKKGNDTAFSIKLPASLLTIAQQENEGITSLELLRKKVANSAYGSKLKLVHDAFKIDTETAQGMFDWSIKNLKRHIKEILKENPKIKYVLVVGGYAECELIQESLTKEFSDRTLVFPPSSSLVVVKGAVLYGHTPHLVKSRNTMFAYGLETTEKYNDSKHQGGAVKTIDGDKYCTNVFHRFVKKNQRLQAGEEVKLRDKPISAKDDFQTFHFYTSSRDDPSFTSHHSCSSLKPIKVPLPKGNRVEDKEYELSVVFGDTEVFFTVTFLKSKETHNGTFNF